MTIESSTGQGAQIEILRPHEGAPEDKVPITQIQTSLLVEDDPKRRAVGRKLLENLGFEVKTRASGPKTLVSLGLNNFDLLLSDLDLGGEVNGLTLIEAARTNSCCTKTFIMSGKASGAQTVPDHTTFIEKPLTSSKLLNAIRDVPNNPM